MNLSQQSNMSCIQLDAQICHGCGFIDYYHFDSNKPYALFCVCEHPNIDRNRHWMDMEDFHFNDESLEIPDAEKIWDELLVAHSKFNFGLRDPDAENFEKMIKCMMFIIKNLFSKSMRNEKELCSIPKKSTPELKFAPCLCHACGFFNYHDGHGLFRGFCVCHARLNRSQYKFHYQMMEDFHFDNERHQVRDANNAWNFMMKFNALRVSSPDETTDEDDDQMFCKNCVGTSESSYDADEEDYSYAKNENDGCIF